MSNLAIFVSTIPGNSLPTKLIGAAVVEHEKSFLIIGGRYNDGEHIYSRTYSDKIYKYEVQGGQWLELSTTLSEGKGWLPTIKVKPSLIGTC